MKKFKELSKKPVKEREQATSKYWKEIDLLNETYNSRDEENRYVFYDGPPTANGKPGIHHVISRTLKDMTCRYKTMQGYKVYKKLVGILMVFQLRSKLKRNLVFTIKKKSKITA